MICLEQFATIEKRRFYGRFGWKFHFRIVNLSRTYRHTLAEWHGANAVTELSAHFRRVVTYRIQRFDRGHRWRLLRKNKWKMATECQSIFVTFQRNGILVSAIFTGTAIAAVISCKMLLRLRLPRFWMTLSFRKTSSSDWQLYFCKSAVGGSSAKNLPPLINPIY